MNPSFDFVSGKPADKSLGRWVEGSVRDNGFGYSFSAKMMVRLRDYCVSHRVSLDVDRPFVASDFAAYLRLLTSGQYATVDRVLGLYETQCLDAAAAASIFNAIGVWVDPWEHDSLPLLQDLASLGQQLEPTEKGETASSAFAKIAARLILKDETTPSVGNDET